MFIVEDFSFYFNPFNNLHGNGRLIQMVSRSKGKKSADYMAVGDQARTIPTYYVVNKEVTLEEYPNSIMQAYCKTPLGMDSIPEAMSCQESSQKEWDI